MLLHFWNRIENMLKFKPRAASTETGCAEPSDAGVAVDVDAQTCHGAGPTCSVPDLLYLLKVIRGNAEFLEVVYGDSIPVRNIMAAIDRACATTPLEKERIRKLNGNHKAGT